MHFSPKILGLSASEKFTLTKVSHIFHIELWETFAFPFEYSILVFSSLVPLSIYLFKKV